MEYKILDANMERLEKKLTRIKNKCSKYGNNFKYEVIREEYDEVKIDGEKEIRHYYIIDAEGTAIVNDWKFIAKIDHTEGGNIFRKASDEEIPTRYRECSSYCEHCKKIRSRKDSFIVMNTKTNEFKQVGRNCLADYTKGLSAEEVAQYVAMYDELIQGEEPYIGGHYTSYIERDSALEIICETVEKFGFAPTSSRYSTKARSTDYYMYFNRKSQLFSKEIERIEEELADVKFKITDATKERCKAALEWLSTQEESNDYMHNLKVVCSMEYLEYKEFGILASLFSVYDKAMARQRKIESVKAKEICSEYVGEIGKRIDIPVASSVIVTSWYTEFGVTFINKITDINGNIFIWKTSHGVDGDTKTIKGTVKEHSEYNGVKQTVLTRCKEIA